MTARPAPQTPKRCARCRKWKPAMLFHGHGRASWCMQCAKTFGKQDLGLKKL